MMITQVAAMFRLHRSELVELLNANEEQLNAFCISNFAVLHISDMVKTKNINISVWMCW